MINVKFILKEPKSTGDTLVYLVMRYSGKRFKYSTNEKVNPKYWSQSNRRVKNSHPDNQEMNLVFDKLEEHVKRIYREAIANSVFINNEYLKESLVDALNQKPVVHKGFYDYLDEFMQAKKGNIKPLTLKKYESLKNHLKRFEALRKKKISFDTINLAFGDEFKHYMMQDQKLLNSSMAKLFSLLKSFLNWATERGYSTNLSYKKFKISVQETSIIYLTQDELDGLYQLDISNNKRLERVRDFFCFGCFTGQRFEDIFRLRKENIRNGCWHLTTSKTRDHLIIPLTSRPLAILKKYNYELPVITNQKTNNYIKEVGKLAGIDEKVVLTKYRGAEELKISRPKYEFIELGI